jgi:hypothetical protein
VIPVESLCFLQADWIKRDGISNHQDTVQADLILLVEAKGFRVVKDEVRCERVPRTVNPVTARDLLKTAHEDMA